MLPDCAGMRLGAKCRSSAVARSWCIGGGLCWAFKGADMVVECDAAIIYRQFGRSSIWLCCKHGYPGLHGIMNGMCPVVDVVSTRQRDLKSCE